MGYNCNLNEPSVSKTLRIPYEMWQSIQALVDSGVYSDFSEAIRRLVEGGMRLISIKDQIKDPEKVKELVQEWDAKMNENEILEWAKNLSDSKLKAVDMLIDLEKETRYKSV